MIINKAYTETQRLYLHTDTNQVLQFIDQYLEKSNLLSQLQNGASMILRYIQDIGAVGLSFVMSFILSFFFMIEKKQMADFSKLFLKSDFDWFFQDIYYFANKIGRASCRERVYVLV